MRAFKHEAQFVVGRPAVIPAWLVAKDAGGKAVTLRVHTAGPYSTAWAGTVDEHEAHHLVRALRKTADAIEGALEAGS